MVLLIFTKQKYVIQVMGRQYKCCIHIINIIQNKFISLSVSSCITHKRKPILVMVKQLFYYDVIIKVIEVYYQPDINVMEKWNSSNYH